MEELLTALPNIISNVGFPIAMCCALFWKISKQDALHKEEINQLSKMINENTIAIIELRKSITKGE